ncbi:uncharacterized protein [Nicotiana tomentosiformis]|uniref:uncharacterized protein n=1 Tax=Nicotiana tomentosiformis TaxID=4098 RepID=UPI00388CC9F6
MTQPMINVMMMEKIQEQYPKLSDIQKEVLTKNEQKWTSLFAGNRLPARGMSLSFISPMIKEGEKIVQLKQEELDKGTIPAIGELERFIDTQWNFASKPKIYFHNDGYFVVRFSNIEDRDEVLYSAPHTINNKPLIIKAWEADFNFNEEVLKTISLWVKFPNLPLNCWKIEMLSRMSSVLGNPIYDDECTTKEERISYVRVLVKINVIVPLPRMIRVQDPKGKIFEQEVCYDWIPEYCEECLQVGHNCNTRNEKQPPEKKKK